MTQPPLARYFNDAENDARGYRRPSTGEIAPGITTILGLINKNLGQYAADETVKWFNSHWAEWNPGEKSDEKAFNHARYRWKDHRDTRAAIGDNVHNYIEDTILGKGPFIDDLTPEEQRIVTNWNDMLFFTGMEFEQTEVTVWGDGYAGTLDCAAWMYSQKLGRKALFCLDWKTSKQAWPDSFSQIAALMNGQFQFEQVEPGTPNADLFKGRDGESWWVEKPMPKFETGAIVHLTQDSWAIHEIRDEGLHWKRFKAYRDAWHVENAIKMTGLNLAKSLGGQDW